MGSLFRLRFLFWVRTILGALRMVFIVCSDQFRHLSPGLPTAAGAAQKTASGAAPKIVSTDDVSHPPTVNHSAHIR